MTITEIPESIQATIHQDAINRVSAFFNASTEDILNELLQNARRSGASTVDISTEGGEISVTDNGDGIGNPETILAFGQSGWDENTTLRENPAGMGIYALARRNRVSVTSKTKDGRTWRVNLIPDHFTGKLVAPIERLEDNRRLPGTTVTFNGEPITEMIEKIARHYPLPVHLNGVEVTRTDFLENARHITSWQGIRIGVYQNHAWERQLNFHGILVKDAKLPLVPTLDDTWFAKADVVDCPHLELTLPSRKEVVQTPFMAELRHECRRAVFRAMLLGNEPVNVSKATQDHAASMGLSLPDAAPRLRTWKAKEGHDDQYSSGVPQSRQVEQNSLVMETDDLCAADQQTLARAMDRNGIIDQAMESDERLQGYRWYDRLTKATKLRITVKADGEEHDLHELRSQQQKPANKRPDSIVFTLETMDGDGNEGEITLPSDVAFARADRECMDDCDPLLTKDSSIKVGELVGLMRQSLFHPSDDIEWGSYENQEELHEAEYERTALTMLASKEAAAIAALVNAVQRHVGHEVPQGKTALIRVTNKGPVDVTLEETDNIPDQG